MIIPPDDEFWHPRKEWERWRAIADKIEANPALLEIPLKNIERWLRGGRVSAQMMNAWRERIEAARSSSDELQKLLAFLARMMRTRATGRDSIRFRGY